jgi:hypothetical protein
MISVDIAVVGGEAARQVRAPTETDTTAAAD